MKLALKYFAVFPSTDGGPPSVGASLDVVFSDANLDTTQISGNVSLTFSHPMADELTFPQVEKLARERVLASL